MSLLHTHTLCTSRHAFKTFKREKYLHYGVFLPFANPLVAADFLGFEGYGAILFVADFLGAADVFFAVALFTLAAFGTCFAICLNYLNYQHKNHLK